MSEGGAAGDAATTPVSRMADIRFRMTDFPPTLRSHD